MPISCSARSSRSTSTIGWCARACSTRSPPVRSRAAATRTMRWSSGCSRWRVRRAAAARRRFLARPTDRAGARRRSRWSPGGRERRSLGRPEAAKRSRRRWRRGEARRRAPRCAPRHGAAAGPRRRSGRLIPPARPRDTPIFAFTEIMLDSGLPPL